MAGEALLEGRGMLWSWRSRSTARSLTHLWLTGFSRHHLAALVEELAHPWEIVVEDHRGQVRGWARKQAAGAGARHRLVFVDRVVATLTHLRHDLPHTVLGLLFGADRSTMTRAIGQTRALLAERGCAAPNPPGVRLRTLEDAFAYARAEGVELRMDATEVQVRRPRASRGGQRTFVSGKKKQNTMKAIVVADHRGRTLWTDAMRPGKMHGATAAHAAGIDSCFRCFPEVEVLLNGECLGPRRDHAQQALTPPRKPNKSALPEFCEQWKHHRHAHSSDRVTVENALADHKRWKHLVRWTHRRENLPAPYRAIAGLVSDRTANV